MFRRPIAVLALAALAAVADARADEGMWLLNNPPISQLKQKYGFEPSREWLEHVQKSCVRFSGASGSIVSRDGLVLTNHHVGSDMLVKLSDKDHDLLKTGFLASSRAEEPKCPGLELHVLSTIEDVTDRVNAAAPPGLSAADANTAHRKAMADLEKATQDKTGLLCQVVTLYQGARYHLYSYKRYTDVRLVFAPEEQIAFFGGDTDNFEFPRFNLDMCLFRIYENGQPIHAEHFLSWSPDGSKEGDLALVVGHPGTTKRLFTTDHLRFVRDVELPTSLRFLWRAEVQVQTFMGRSADNARLGADDWANVSNSRKAYTGQYASLLDPALTARKLVEEKRLRDAVTANPQWKKDWGDAWDRLGAAESSRKAWHSRYHLSTRAPRSDLYDIARDLVRLADELPKPSADRLREFRDSELDSLYLKLYSPAPVEDPLETFRLSSSLSLMAETLGADDPAVQAALLGKSPQARAEDLVKGTTLRDIDARKALAKGGKAAIDSSKDPLIRLAASLDHEARAIRTFYENTVEAVERDSYAKIAAAKFAVEGENSYPDATGTLRLSFGPVKGYAEEGRQVPAFTDFAGMYQRYQERKDQPGFELPERWLTGKDKIDLKTPFNFVFCGDIIGGNSGSPVINTRGQVIGLVFDGNIHSLAGAFVYDDTQNRAVAVDSRAMIEAMRKLYNAGALADEITAPAEPETTK